MRKILFKAISKTFGWTEGYYVVQDNGVRDFMVPVGDNEKRFTIINPETLCQYTGFTDKNGKMIFDHFDWQRDGKEVPKIHPTQKPVNVLKRLIEIFTDPGEIVIDPVAGSGATLRAAYELKRNSYGFEIDRDFYRLAIEKMLEPVKIQEVIR